MQFPFVRAGAGGLAALLLLAGLTPRAASASCGDYVIYTGSGVHRAAANHQTNSIGALPNVVSRMPAAPCRGPHCSGRRDVPSAPPAPVQTQPRSDTPGILMADDRGNHPGRAFWVTSDHSLPPREVISSIFHPPRSAA